MDPAELLEYLAEGLVDDPEQVAVERFEEHDGSIVCHYRLLSSRFRHVFGPVRSIPPANLSGRLRVRVPGSGRGVIRV